MDALRKQASKIREQVAKQQHAVIKQFTVSGYESSAVMVTDEIELQRHQQLEKLYKSTRTGRDFQREIVRATEAITSVGYSKMSEECTRYGVEGTDDALLAKAASLYGEACTNTVRETEELNRVFSLEVMEPLKAMANGAPLEDARHLAQRYSRMRHDAELQAAEVSRRQARVRETASTENIVKLQASEAKMQEIKANMAVLGKEAAAALAAVEAQQQRLTHQRLLALVNAEKNYHRRLAVLLDEAEAEMVSDKQRKESAPPIFPSESCSEKALYFWAEATHAFIAESDKELSLDIGDYVVVRQVSPSGWSEGECRGRAGWFPSAYVEKRQGIPVN
ncbi:SH3 domain-containing protein 3 [Nymphaea thermarum]|nr:SH3 domain-containing protein 3 [Nymphaea thermarum]